MESFDLTEEVWVENLNKETKDENGNPYLLAKIVSFDKNKNQYEVSFKTIKKPNEMVKADSIIPFFNNIDINVNDMMTLERLNEVDLLNNIKNRYFLNKIQTNVGSTLIIVNPYQKITDLFGEKEIEKFIKINSKFPNINEKRSYDNPHLFDNTVVSILKLIQTHKNQAIIISGESGSGKTESAKNSMKCITSYFGKRHSKNSSVSIEDQILSCNPILEAFGNAKTVRNDNSSRFGKYVTINLRLDDKEIHGAQIQTYLLEKSRVCRPNLNERNFHIFYQLLAGFSKESLGLFGLEKDPKLYKYLEQSKCWDVNGIDDKEAFNQTKQAFETLGFMQEEVLSIFKILAACLLLGNLDFKEAAGCCEADHSNNNYLKNACELIGIDCETLENSLTHNTRNIQGISMKSPLRLNDCYNYKNNFVKELYHRLFNWIVRKLNKSLSNNSNVDQERDIRHIGLLDIFGFECFEANSFEQFCINFANEKLQQLYINDVFKSEIDALIKEGVTDDLSEFKFVDNQAIIDLFEKSPLGIFQLLDESCLTNVDDKSFLAKINKIHSLNAHLKIPKLIPNTIRVTHTAKEVDYNVTGFVAKNLDEVKQTMIDLMKNSSQQLIKYIFFQAFNENEFKNELNLINEERDQKKSNNDKYLGVKFRKEIDKLMKELSTCECHYIRCIKPNEKKEKNLFVPNFAFQQIRYLGILDTINVRKSGYPVKINFKDFYFRFEEACNWPEKKNSVEYLKKDENNKIFKELTIKCLNSIKPEGFTKKDLVLGSQKILLKTEFNSFLEMERSRILKKKNELVLKIQKNFKRFIKRDVYLFLRKSAIFLQHWFRKQRFRIKFKNIRNAALKIQIHYKSYIYQKTLLIMTEAVRFIQKNILMYLGKMKLLKMKIAGRFINKKIRQFYQTLKSRHRKTIKNFVFEVIENSWKVIYNRYRNLFATKIQSYFRGFRSKIKNWLKVIKGRFKRSDYMRNKSSIKIQKSFRGHTVRLCVKIMREAANRIISYWKMKALSGIIKLMRISSKLIQKNFLIYLKRKAILNDIFEFYFQEDEENLQRDRLETINTLFGENNSDVRNGEFKDEKKSTIDQDNSKYSKYFLRNTELEFKTIIQTKKKKTVVYPELPSFNDPKIVLFAKVLDLNFTVVSNEIYDKNWAKEFESIFNQNLKNSSPIIQIEVGGCHTLVLNSKGKIFSWGWNNHGQCGFTKNTSYRKMIIPENSKTHKVTIQELPLINLIENPKHITDPKLQNIRRVVAGDEHSFFIDQEDNVFVTGNNNRGQLGLGNDWEIKEITLIEAFKGKCRIIKSAGRFSLIITKSEEVFIWPYYSYLQPLKFQFKTPIQTLSCGVGFAILLSSNGIVYSMGQQNKSGELGQGDFNERLTPEPILFFLENKEKIEQISCGAKHTIVKNSNGKIYTWGLNKNGQLGLGKMDKENSPKLVNLQKISPLKIKAVQVAAGFKISYILSETRSIIFFGTNSENRIYRKPTKFDLNKKIPDFSNETLFSPVKILTTWNNSIDVFYAIFSDLRDMSKKGVNQKKIGEICNILAFRWINDSFEPPFIEGINSYFNTNVMKKEAKQVDKNKLLLEKKLKINLKKLV